MPRRTGLEIQFRARIKELEKDLKEGRKIQQREIARMQKDLKKANDKIKKMTDKAGASMVKSFKKVSGKNIAEITSATFLADAAFRALAKATRAMTFAFREMMASVARVDELSKMSRNLGLSFESMQALRTSFAEGGVSVESFIKSMVKFNTVIGEAATGELEYKEIFDEVGIAIHGANGKIKDTETLLLEVSHAMKHMGLSSAEQARLMKDLFGRQGARWIEVMRQGPEAIYAMKQAAMDTGRVLHSTVGRSLEEIDNLQTVIQHQVETEAAMAMANWRTEAEALLEVWGAIKRAVISAVGWLGKFIGQDLAGRSTDELHEQIEATKEQMKLDRKRLQTAKEKGLETQAIRWTRQLERGHQILKDINAELETRNTPMVETTAAAGQHDWMAESQDMLGDMNAKYEIQLEKDEAEKAKQAAKEKLEMQRKQNEAMAEGQRLLQEMNDAYDLEQLDKQSERIKEMTDLIDTQFEGALDAALDGTKSLKEAFTDMAKSIIADLVKMIAKQMLFNALAAMMPGGVGADGSFSIAKGLGLDKIIGFHRGGAFDAGQPMEVGEQGRELIVPSVAGRVLSRQQAQQAANMGGGVTVVQNMNFAVGVVDTVRAEIENMRPDLVESAKMGVVEAKQRGAISGAFQ